MIAASQKRSSLRLPATRVLKLVPTASGRWRLIDNFSRIGGTFGRLQSALYHVQLEASGTFIMIEGGRVE